MKAQENDDRSKAEMQAEELKAENTDEKAPSDSTVRVEIDGEEPTLKKAPYEHQVVSVPGDMMPSDGADDLTT